MKQDKIFEYTKKAKEAPLEFTNLLLNKTEKLLTPSPMVNKIGQTIGVCIAVVLLVTGTIQLFIGKPFLAIGSLSIGAVTVISNIICHNK